MEELEYSRGVVLVIDDNVTNLKVASEHLRSAGFEVLTARDGESGIQRAQLAQPELILMDVQMPGIDGFETCRRLKLDEQTKAIPVIFMTVLTNVEDKLKGFAAGGVDYVPKPFQFEELLARVQSQLTLYRQRKQIEELRQKEQFYFKTLSELKDRFVSTASHDLKGPINSINGYLDLVEEMMDITDPQLKLFLSRIRYNADHMLDLVNDLLDLTKIEMGETLDLQPVSLVRLLEECLVNFELAARNKQIALNFDSTLSPTLVVYIDRRRMLQIINNLLSNSLKYSEEGGQIKLVAHSDDKQIVIQVSDTGLGIPEKDLPHLFDRFYRVHTKGHLDREGSGLGLAIVKSLVERHKGQIEVQSQVGAGTTFTMTFPLDELLTVPQRKVLLVD